MISLFCFAILLVLFVSFFKKGSDILSPARLFAMVWLIAIGLAELKFSRYQFEWSLYSWLMLMVAIGGTMTGMYTVYVLRYNSEYKSIEVFKNDVFNIKINENRFFKILVIFFIVYVLSFVVSFLTIGYIPLFTKHPEYSRKYWGVFGWGLFVQAVPTLLYLISVYFFYIRGKAVRKTVLMLFFIFAFVSYSVLLQRYYLILFLLLFFILWYYRTKKIKIRIIVILLMIVVAIIYLMSSVRVAKTLTGLLYYISEMRFGKEYSLFTEPYMYIVMNLENFASGVSSLASYTYGYYTFDFIFALTGLKHTIAEYAFIGDFPGVITQSYNTYTMYFIYYRDFGVIGLGSISFIMGVLFSTSYYYMRSKINLTALSIYGMLVFVILFSFFVPILTWLHFVFNFILICLITRKIETNKKDKSELNESAN